MANGLKPFRVKPYLVWTAVITLLVIVIFASTRSNYVVLTPSPTQTVPSQIPDSEPTPPIVPNILPPPAPKLGMPEVNLVLQPLSRTQFGSPVGMVSLEDAEDVMYQATFNDIFTASENQGFMEKSVDVLYDVTKLTPPRLMTDEV